MREKRLHALILIRKSDDGAIMRVPVKGQGDTGEDHEPFAKLDVARKDKRTEPRSSRRQFRPSNVLKLPSAAIEREDDQLAGLIRPAK